MPKKMSCASWESEGGASLAHPSWSLLQTRLQLWVHLGRRLHNHVLSDLWLVAGCVCVCVCAHVCECL
jgi:hypothetical protein